jgi:uncharacterized small protein (DUF1192 family)
MLIALRDMSIGDDIVQRGDVVTAAQQDTLPAGRVESLKRNRWVEEISDEQRVAQAVAGMFERISVLEERIAVLEQGRVQKPDGRSREARQAKKQMMEATG